MRQVAIDAASIPKDAKIAALGTVYRVSHFQFGNFESLYFEKYLT